ncbi:hypothetical protein [Rhodopseudomonas sp. BR0M22]|uniref:hypothetical protein n=1 Tax=Rhodopseudomonas sp. BR0M22 TaxID=2269369 RepID=UPI0013E0014B
MTTVWLATVLLAALLAVRHMTGTSGILLLLTRTRAAALLLLAARASVRVRILLILIRHRESPSTECRTRSNNDQSAPGVARLLVIFARLLRGSIAPDGTALFGGAVHRAEGCTRALLPQSRPTVRKLRSEATFRLPGPSPHRVCSASAISKAVPFALQSTVFRVPILRVL